MPNIGETFRVTATMTDLTGAPFTPATHSIALYAPGRSLSQTLTVPTLTGAGQYYIDFTTATTDPFGLWEVIWTALGAGGLPSGIGKIKIFIGDPPSRR